MNKHARLIVESADSPRPLSKVTQHWARRIENRNAIKDARRANNQDFDNAIKEAMLDSGATSNFIQSADGFELTGPSSKTVSTANGQLMRATMTALLPLTQLRAGARKAIVIPELKQALMSIKRQIRDTQQFSILTLKGSPSTTTTASNLSQANHHCSKGGEKRGDCGL